MLQLFGFEGPGCQGLRVGVFPASLLDMGLSSHC